MEKIMSDIYDELKATQIYLQATAELLEQGNQRFFAYFHKNIKNGEGYE